MKTNLRHPRGDVVRRFGIAAAFLFLPTLACGQDAPQTDVGRVKALVSGGRYADAVFVVQQVEGSVADANAAFELQFLKGAAAQQIASDRSQPEAVRTSAFAQAEAAYQRARQLRPESLATLNNLAALQASAGNAEQAATYYREATTRAMAKGDPNLETYAFNYARFLQERDGAEAIRYAVIAVKAPRSGAESRALLVVLYARYQPAALLPFARTLLDEGRTTKVIELAQVNVKSADLAPNVRRDWFSLLALAMARDALGQVAYDPGPTLAPLGEFRTADPLAPAAMQLVGAVREPPVSANSISWWRDNTDSNAVRVNPRAAMRELLISLGQRNVRAIPAQLARADGYFRTAIEFGDRGPDPDAFLSLADMYASNGGIAMLHELMNHYEGALFSEKGGAIARGDWQLTFRLHTALGMAYAHLGVWKSPSPYQNALYQLDAARTAAERLNEQARRMGQPAIYALPPAAVEKLSEGYEAVGRPLNAIAVRVDSAEMLFAAGRRKESASVFKSIDGTAAGAMNPATKEKYERLRGRAEPS